MPLYPDLIVLLAAGCSLIYGVVLSYRRIYLYRWGRWADAQHVGWVPYSTGYGTHCRPRVRFIASDEKEYEISKGLGQKVSQGLIPKKSYRVLYLRHEPEKGVIYSFWFLWAEPLLFAGVGLFFCVLYLAQAFGWIT